MHLLRRLAPLALLLSLLAACGGAPAAPSPTAAPAAPTAMPADMEMPPTAAATPAPAPTSPPAALKIVASTSWVAAFAKAAGATDITVIAPSNLQHPPDYDPKPADLAAVSGADYVLLAGFEGFAARMQEAVGGDSAKLVTVMTENSPAAIRAEVTRLGELFGTQEQAAAWLTSFDAEYARLSDEVKASLGDSKPVVVAQAFVTPWVIFAGLEPAGTYGPMPVTPDELKTLADAKPAVVFENVHMGGGAPVVEATGATKIDLVNFPGEDLDLLAVFAENARRIEAALGGGAAGDAAARTQYPLSVTGCNGHTATFAGPPQTTVTMDPQAFELMFWLGLGDRQIAAGPQPLPAVPDQFKEAAQAVPAIARGDADYPSKEALLAAKPDFVYGSYQSGFSGELVFSEDDWAARDVSTYLSFGIGGCTDDTAGAARTSLDATFRDIETLGKIFDVQDRAQALIAQLKRDLSAARTSVDTTKQLRVATFEIAEYSDGKPTIYGSASATNAVITLAGGVNAFADVADAYAVTNWEEFVKRDPQVILLIAYPAAVPQAWDDAEKLLTELPALQNVSAVKTRSFVRVTFPEVGSGGVRNVDAVKKLAEALAGVQ